MNLSLPHGKVEIMLNGKWETVVVTDSPDIIEVKEIADMYNVNELRYVEGNVVIKTYRFE